MNEGASIDAGPLGDARVTATLSRMYREERARCADEADMARRWAQDRLDPFAWKGISFPLRPDQGALLYLLARATGATRVVEFATALGFSTIYLAAAVRDNGGGRVVTAELVPDKAEQARSNLREAGLDGLVEVRDGDATAALRDVEGPVDLLLLDGWPTDRTPSLARQILDLVRPTLRPGALVMNDNGERDYLDHVRDEANGYRTLKAPLASGGYLSVFDGGASR